MHLLSITVAQFTKAVISFQKHVGYICILFLENSTSSSLENNLKLNQA